MGIRGGGSVNLRALSLARSLPIDSASKPRQRLLEVEGAEHDDVNRNCVSASQSHRPVYEYRLTYTAVRQPSPSLFCPPAEPEGNSTAY